ncbi:predicted protein [Micromonas commoda]|uniref:Uncharacterized protein n=1 Tax=Micromonas commoda (strain RCC299 / NOUM17 / CCMP2709) TaxID=296587 RepID=C1FGL0_MICCC|nr:predicted protein [Micromonas commoda]ACO69281.1 predicted protein [Micromonas commoda]|eukprot:XP_002508023.1 predicted protein [Micromonas commoda]
MASRLVVSGIAMPRTAAAARPVHRAASPSPSKASRATIGIGRPVKRNRSQPSTAASAVEQASGASTSSPVDCLPALPDDSLPDAVVQFLRREGRHAVFSATKVGVVEVNEVEGGRSLREYMSLPASQYSTLDGERVERVGDDTFVCTLGAFDFLGFRLQPVLTARVDVRPDGQGCVIRVVSAEIHGSGVVESVNGMFEIDSVNRVGWNERCNPGTGQCEIASETKVTVYLLVPKWFPFTVKATERTGNFVVSQVVNQVVPRFLSQLVTDYEAWAAGDESREAKGADLFAVDLETK